MKKRAKNLCLLLASLMVFLVPLPILSKAEPLDDSNDRSKDQTLAPYFFIQGQDSSADHFPLKETKVSTSINGIIAETYVTQTYANEGQEAINASYVFPASTKVSVHGMTMEIGDQVITAKIKEKEEAKEEFEEAKSEGKSASLLEQQRANAFTMDVANIMPGDTIRIQLHYTELISSVDGTYQFVFPTVVGPRYLSGSAQEETDGWAAAPYLEESTAPPGSYEIEVNLSAGLPVSDITCSSHEIQVTSDQTSSHVTLANPQDYAGNRDFILDYKLTGEEINCGLMLDSSEDGGENFFMLMVQPPERYQPEEILPREYIFVLDVSGSMNGYPLDTAKELIRNLVSSLNDTDYFNLVLFADEAVTLSDRSLSATQDNIDSALDFIDRSEGGGGTELAPALRIALETPRKQDMVRSVVSITDGYISGEREIFDIVKNNLHTTNFFSFGIGTSVNRYLIEGIAKTGAGEAFVVTDSQDALKAAEQFCTYIQAPVLTDIEVSYDGFDVYQVEPALPAALFAKKPIILFGKYKGDPSGTIKITGKTGSQDYTMDIPVSEVTPMETNRGIRYLWARTRVEELTDYGTSLEIDEAVQKEVTEIGLTYSMMTDYTSFIAVTDTIRNQTGESTDVEQPLPLPSHVSNLAVGGYMAGSEPEMILLLCGMTVIMFLGLIRRRACAAKKRRTL
ncbi:MAG: VWA domain-containing protein [Lachnospiraceae bacterium]|jgi:Ca-activated chloride channel family protein|nr:VWA domain-containing protein [Lachnospiraceae bacterium]